jgi:hypothetical protein
MRYFRYAIHENEIQQSLGEVDDIPSDFIEYTVSLLGDSVYYYLRDGKLREVVSEGSTEDLARERVEEFLATFNVNLV